LAREQSAAERLAVRRSGNEAFYIPQRVVVAFVLSMFLQTIIFVGTYQAGLSIRNSILTSPQTILESVHLGLFKLVDLYYSQYGTELFHDDVQDVLAKCREIAAEFENLAESFLVAFILAFCCSNILFVAAWVSGLQTYKAMIMSARKGDKPWSAATKLADAVNYVGIQMSNGIVSHVLFTTIFTLVGDKVSAVLPVVPTCHAHV
jgi:hypothetical protein